MHLPVSGRHGVRDHGVPEKELVGAGHLPGGLRTSFSSVVPSRRPRQMRSPHRNVGPAQAKRMSKTRLTSPQAFPADLYWGGAPCKLGPLRLSRATLPPELPCNPCGSLHLPRTPQSHTQPLQESDSPISKKCSGRKKHGLLVKGDAIQAKPQRALTVRELGNSRIRIRDLSVSHIEEAADIKHPWMHRDDAV